MTKKQKAYKLAADLGATITDDVSYVFLDAPYGQIFGGDSHTCTYYVEEDGRKGLWSLVIEDLGWLGKCVNVESCDFCQSNKTAEAGA